MECGVFCHPRSFSEAFFCSSRPFFYFSMVQPRRTIEGTCTCSECSQKAFSQNLLKTSSTDMMFM